MGLSFLDRMSADSLCFLDRLSVLDSFWHRAMPKSKTNFCQLASIEDLIASRSHRAFLASSQRWAVSRAGASPLGPGVLAVGKEAVEISSREVSSISASSGVLTWDDVSTCLGKSSGLAGRGVTKIMGSSLFGVELPDACPEVSNTAWDRSSFTYVVMLTCPSAFSGGALMGLAVRIGVEQLPRGGALSSGPSMVNCRMSTCR